MSQKTPGTSWATLRQLLVDQYDDLRRRLTRRLGSADVAQEALHELYLRMDQSDGIETPRNPAAYLLTSAVNLARDRWRTENRRAQRIDVEAVYELIDETPGPDQIAEDRSQLAALLRAIQQLPTRQRAILVATRFEHLPQSEIARRLDISTRLVQIELQRALEFCEEYLEKNIS